MCCPRGPATDGDGQSRGASGDRVAESSPGTGGAAPVTPPPGRVAIEVEAGSATTTIFIRGELDLVTMPLLADKLARILPCRPGRIVFDLSGTTFMDCGSARLIARSGRSLPGGRRPVIRCPRPGARRVLDLTGLSAYCEIEE